MRWYFAYGSNVSTATLVGRRGLAPSDSRPGTLAGYALTFDLPVGPGERGVGNLRRDAGATVHGVVYLLNVADVERLDRTEGVPGGLYDKLDVTVVTPAGDVDAFTYVSPHRDPSRKPSLRYRDIILDGAREHGLASAWITHLESFELAWDERDGARNPTATKPAR